MTEGQTTFNTEDMSIIYDDTEEVNENVYNENN